MLSDLILLKMYPFALFSVGMVDVEFTPVEVTSHRDVGYCAYTNVDLCCYNIETVSVMSKYMGFQMKKYKII